MKKLNKTLTLFLLVMNISLMAQVKLETLTEYTAIDDSTYRAGQELTFNKGKIDGYFFYIYDAVFSYKKEIERKAERNVSVGAQDRYPFTGKTYTIKEFIKRTEGGDVKTYTVITDGINKFYVDMDNSIRHREYVNDKNKYMYFDGQLVDAEMAFKLLLKAKGNVKDYMEEYMWRFNRDELKKYWNDEFEFYDKKLEWTAELKNYANGIGEELVLNGPFKLKFNDYNFEGGYFPIDLDNNSQFKYIRVLGPGVPTASDYEKTGISLVFSNTADFNKLKMERAKAKEFLQSRKSSHGTIKRDLVTMIHFTIDYDLTRENMKQVTNGEYQLMAKIEFIVIYEDDTFTRRIHVIQ